jgi:hypothetical protein
MIHFINAKRLFQFVLVIFLLVCSSTLSAEEDKRTPLERYQGAYQAAFLTCALHQKILLLEKAKQKGTTPESELGKDVIISKCKEDHLLKMKKEYNNVLPLIATDEGKAALKEHYVHAIMHIKEIDARTKENDETYTDRMAKTYRKSRELYVRFEITQP